MKHAGNLQNISEQNLHEVSFHGYSGVQITKNMCEAHGTCGRQKRFLQGSEAETWEKEPTWKTGVDGTTLLKWNF
jgi:hypothetical protein